MFALTLPSRLPNFCSAIRATLGQRQIRQSPGLALNAHSGNEWGKIPVLTGLSPCCTPHLLLSFIPDIETCLPVPICSHLKKLHVLPFNVIGLISVLSILISS